MNEGWSRVRNARGGAGSHHETFEFHLPDGRILRTRISHPPDRSTYGADVWRHILRDQLGVSEAEFWACVKDGVTPRRAGAEAPKEAVPAEIAYLLVNRAGVPEGVVMKLGRQEAIERLNQYWAESGSNSDRSAGDGGDH
jgi:hypothetical protein